MKPIGVMSTAALFLLLGIAAPANGRQEKPEEKAPPPKQQQQAKPEKQQPQAKAPKQEQQAKAPKQEQQAKPEKQQQQAKAPKQEQAKPEKQQQAKAPKQEQPVAPEKQQQQAKQQQQQKSNSAKQQPAHQQQASYSHAPQRTQQAIATQRAQPALRLSVRGSGRIPDDRFHANFGREHNFHMGNPVLVGGYSRFQYGGFWFGFVQPWPSGWYYTDDVYIDYVDGGYYMYNPYYPGARFSISVVI
jgi:primosomal protein N'